MTRQPELRTERLHLRPFTLNDAKVVQMLVGDREIAATTSNIPHPYKDGMAEAWISTHSDHFRQQEAVIYAMVLRPQNTLIGAISLSIGRTDDRAELGYWIGRPYWGNGYGTEAARAIIEYGFTQLGLNRIYATHFTRNPASGRVMEKAGMKYEGLLRQHVKKWGVFEDLKLYGILKSEYLPDDVMPDT